MPSNAIAIDIGATLRHLRIERNVSQEDLAARTGVHPNSIGAYENGRTGVPFVQLVRIANGLGLEPVEVVAVYQDVAAGRLTATRRRRTVA